MARIPIYRQQAMANAGAMPAGMRAGSEAAGLSALGSGLEKIAGAMERREQVEFSLEKERIESEGRIQFASMAADYDAKQYEVLTKAKQTAAPGAPDFHKSYMEQFEAFSADTLKNAPNGYVRNLMQSHVARAKEAYSRDAFSFQNGEYQRHLGQQFDEGVQKDAVLVNANPALFETIAGKWAYAADGFQSKPEVRAKLRELAKNTLAPAAVKGFIDSNPAKAAEFFRHWREGTKAEGAVIPSVEVDGVKVPFGLLDLKQAQELERYATQKNHEVETANNAGLFISAAKQAVSSAPMLPGDVIDLPAAKASAVNAAGNLKPEQQFQLESYVEKIAADRERDVKRARESSVASVFTQLDQNGGDYQAVIRGNPWIASQPNDVQSRINQYAVGVATGATRETDPILYVDLVENPGKLKATNLDAIRDRFNYRELSQLKRMQKDLLSGETNEQNLVGTHSLIKGMLEEAGYKDKAIEGKYFALVQNAVDQELAATGKKKLPQKRIEEIAQDLLVKEKIKGGGLFGMDTEKTAFTLEVPEASREEIIRALQEKKIPVNDYNILRAWRNRQAARAAPASYERSPLVDMIPR